VETGEGKASTLRHSIPARLAAALLAALLLGLAAYALLEAIRPDSGLVSFSFLLVLPAVLSGFVAWAGDPWGERGLRFYLLVPVWLVLLVILASAVLLREGVICILILSPLWLISGWVGVLIARALKRRLGAGGTHCAALLALPLLVLQAEPYWPLPVAEVSVSRSAIVAAPVERIWPLLRGIPDVHPGEGQWNLSQDVIGIPRPRGARLVGEGIGAERRADWGRSIRFGERITEWRPGRRIGWEFRFDDIAGWAFTDRHLMPDSPYFRVVSGGYTVEPLAGGRTRVRLETRYRLRTPVNFYAALWGELFLGDLENNLLALVRQRAER
jgi:Polyketide cyclase / dehydrase and lipid transport